MHLNNPYDMDDGLLKCTCAAHDYILPKRCGFRSVFLDQGVRLRPFSFVLRNAENNNDDGFV